MITPPVNFIIRDGIESDIAACLALDHSYQTDRVWQMSLQPEKRGWQVTFRAERLPRTITLSDDGDALRLRHALPADQCFLVAATDEQIIGYLTMQPNRDYPHGVIQDIIVDAAYRRQGVASRLVRITRHWAQEHDLRRLMIATRTKNYPAILFCQQNGFAFCGFNDEYYPNHDIAVFFGQSLR